MDFGDGFSAKRVELLKPRFCERVPEKQSLRSFLPCRTLTISGSHAAIDSRIGRLWQYGSRKRRLRKTHTGCGAQLLDWLRRDTFKSMTKPSIAEINPARDRVRRGWRPNLFGSVRACT